MSTHATMEPNELLQFANRFFGAYNAVDTNTLATLISEDLHWEHHNRFKGSGKEGFLDSIRKFDKTVPGRYFAEITRWAANGDVIYVEHKWHGTPAEDMEAFGWKAGAATGFDCCGVLVFKDGVIVEFSDYA